MRAAEMKLDIVRARKPRPRLRHAVTIAVTLAVALGATLLSGCEREERRLSEPPPSSGRINSIVVSDLVPGEQLPKRPATENAYEENAWAISEGQHLFQWFNCNGCHSNGGGGMGPALMDDEWIYGSDPANIFATIVQGRPNGMPSFRGRIADHQVWQIVAYVRSLSGQVPFDVTSPRTDHLQGTDQAKTDTTPKRTFVPPAAQGTQ
jgi:cytochrome c oxidase cbb3-type subunit III